MSVSTAELTAPWSHARARLVRLESEVDDTYRAEFDDGPTAIVKVAVPGTDPASLDFETAIVEAALAADPALPLAPTLVTLRGDTRVEVDGRWVRLVACLPGVDAAASPVDLSLVREIGRSSARLTRALEGFRHPADQRPVAWDLRTAPVLRERAALLGDAVARDDIGHALDDLAAVLPALARLPHQVVHDDVNGGNVLVRDGQVTGIVDFGDAGFAPRACDVGIAMSYTLGYTSEPDVLAAPAAFLDGYGEVIALTRGELGVLPVLVRARAAQRVLMSLGGSADTAEGRRDEAARIGRAATDLRRLTAAYEQRRG